MNNDHAHAADAATDAKKLREQVDLACADCGNLMLSRAMFTDLHKMVEKNPKMQQSDYFYDYLADTYVAHVTMMLRKHTKLDKNSISLTALARKIFNSRDRLEGTFNEAEFSAAMESFSDHARKVEGFADRVVAHRDRRSPDHIPTYGEIEQAIDAMDKLCVQCSLAVGGNYCDTCMPAVQSGWLTIFRDMGIET